MVNSSSPISEFVSFRNENKAIFTAGPASLLSDNILGLRPCFGRGDDDYSSVESSVLTAILALSGHQSIARMQGSASFAIEVMISNFLEGDILVVDSGFYSSRLFSISYQAQSLFGNINSIDCIPYEQIHTISKSYDWVVSCYTETSNGLLLSIESLSSLAKKVSARLMLDATASIGLEDKHYLADVIAFSSCKGLFGLTGASFVAFNELPNISIPSFNLSLDTHINKQMTGPYHAICSLFHVLQHHQVYRNAVQKSKNNFLNRMSEFLVHDHNSQPLLCTHVSCSITSSDSRCILYQPRKLAAGSVVCHLGEVHNHNIIHSSINDLLEVTL